MPPTPSLHFRIHSRALLTLLVGLAVLALAFAQIGAAPAPRPVPSLSASS